MSLHSQQAAPTSTSIHFNNKTQAQRETASATRGTTQPRNNTLTSLLRRLGFLITTVPCLPSRAVKQEHMAPSSKYSSILNSFHFTSGIRSHAPESRSVYDILSAQAITDACSNSGKVSFCACRGALSLARLESMSAFPLPPVLCLCCAYCLSFGVCNGCVCRWLVGSDITPHSCSRHPRIPDPIPPARYPPTICLPSACFVF